MSGDFFWGFVAGMFVMFIVSIVWAGNRFWQMWLVHKEDELKMFQLEQKIVHIMEGKVEVEWTDANMLVVKPKKKIWEEDVYVPGTDTVIIDDNKDY